MSERWVLVPSVITDAMFDAGFDGSNHQESWANTLAARPPVSREWLDAAVERGARAIWGDSEAMPWELNKDTIVGKAHRAVARAAILAALEMTDG